jgi:hypothetical protein
MNIIWVSPEGRAYSKAFDESTLGGIRIPVQTIQDAMNKIAYSDKAFWTVYVSPGFYPGSFSIPANKIICIIGASRATSIGDCVWKVAGRLSSIIMFRNIAVNKLRIEDNAIEPADLATFALENCSINEIIKVGSSRVDVAISSISAASSDFAETLGGAGVVYGDVNIPGCYLLANNISFTGGRKIACAHAKMQDCLIEQDLSFSSKKVILKGTEWMLDKLTITFTGSAGKLIMDPISLNSFKKHNIKLINGTIEVL